jgi:NAD(P)H-flavin reductase
MIKEKTGALYELKKDKENHKEELPFRLIDKKQITHDSYIFIFELPKEMILGLPIGQHLAIE